MNSMKTAPIDGSRFLAVQACMYFDGWNKPWKQRGTRIVEAFWDDGEFRLWQGTKAIQTTEKANFLGWAPIPEELRSG